MCCLQANFRNWLARKWGLLRHAILIPPILTTNTAKIHEVCERKSELENPLIKLHWWIPQKNSIYYHITAFCAQMGAYPTNSSITSQPEQEQIKISRHQSEQSSLIETDWILVFHLFLSSCLRNGHKKHLTMRYL